MPVENFRVRKTTEHVGVRSEQLVLFDLPTISTTGSDDLALYVNKNSGIVYRKI